MLQWQCENCNYQSAYQIELYRGKQLFFGTGKINSDQMQYEVQQKLSSRDCITWRIKLWDENGEEGDWSSLFSYEMGLLQVEDWKAKWIEPEITLFEEADTHCQDAMNRLAKSAWNEQKHKKKEQFLPHQPASYLKKEFTIEQGKTARLYISAHGLYEVFLNGKRIGNAVLMPGSSNYHYEVKYQVYDVTELLKTGKNEIEILLGDGWYRSTSGVDGDRDIYGERLAVIAQLEVEKQIVMQTDESWLACQDGPLAQNDMQQGEVYDARREAVYRKQTEYEIVFLLYHDICIYPSIIPSIT